MEYAEGWDPSLDARLPVWEALHQLIRSLDIPAAEKERLLAMTPASYVGKATELARRV